MSDCLNIRRILVTLVLISVLCVGVRFQYRHSAPSRCRPGLKTARAVVLASSPPQAVGATLRDKPTDTIKVGDMGQHRREGLLDLTRLSPPTRRSLSLLLLIPLCALVTCVFRIFIGVETSGRFTPALLAIALVLTNWRLGLVAILLVIFLGLVTRDALEKLRLLVLPRLSVVLTLVVYCFALGGGLIEHFQWNRGPHMLLLPIVILTMIIERFYVAAQEEGGTVAARRLAGTGLVCVFCYLTLQWETAGRWLLAYPELHLVTVAAFILMGRYRGYQLAELWRFRDLASERDS